MKPLKIFLMIITLIIFFIATFQIQPSIKELINILLWGFLVLFALWGWLDVFGRERIFTKGEGKE